MGQNEWKFGAVVAAMGVAVVEAVMVVEAVVTIPAIEVVALTGSQGHCCYCGRRSHRGKFNIGGLEGLQKVVAT